VDRGESTGVAGRCSFQHIACFWTTNFADDDAVRAIAQTLEYVSAKIRAAGGEAAYHIAWPCLNLTGVFNDQQTLGGWNQID